MPTNDTPRTSALTCALHSRPEHAVIREGALTRWGPGPVDVCSGSSARPELSRGGCTRVKKWRPLAQAAWSLGFVVILLQYSPSWQELPGRNEARGCGRTVRGAAHTAGRVTSPFGVPGAEQFALVQRHSGPIPYGLLLGPNRPRLTRSPPCPAVPACSRLPPPV